MASSNRDLNPFVWLIRGLGEGSKKAGGDETDVGHDDDEGHDGRSIGGQKKLIQHDSPSAV